MFVQSLQSTTPTPLDDFQVKVMDLEIWGGGGGVKCFDSLLFLRALDGFNLYWHLN